MNFFKHFLAIIVIVVFISCSSSATDLVVENPVAATLVFPENNIECNEGVILNEMESKVVFRWNTSDYTDVYELVVENKLTDNTSSYQSDLNFKEITLERGVNYEWHVISKSMKSQETAKSETFQFFNAAPGVVSHVPFSAVVLSPPNGSEVTAIAGKVNLQWVGSDLDNDIENYEIFFGDNENQLKSKGLTADLAIEVEVISDITYFWMVKSKDETNNISTSEIFQFTVE